jgi:4-amino-4-deoxy-L-arabinose transferase-like glycosyltransferase
MKLRVRSKYTLILGLLILAASWKTALLVANVFPFNSDEAVVALMARHILQGERPVFFYGQAYMGSLDAYLIALGFRLLGEGVWVIRLVQVVLYSGFIVSLIWLGIEGLGSIESGMLAALLLAAPTVNMTLYTTVTLGGYGEALILGNLVLICALRITKSIVTGPGDQRNPRPLYFWSILFGLFSGLGLWTLGLTIVYVVPAGLFILWKIFDRRFEGDRWKTAIQFTGAAVIGIFAGASPWWIYAAQHGPASLLGELLGSAVAVEQTSFLARAGQHLINLLLLGIPVTIGMRPPWNVTWLALPLAPFVLAGWVGVGIYTVKAIRQGKPAARFMALLCGIAILLALAFIFTPFGTDPSGRYFLPVNVVFALLAAEAIRSFPYPGAAWKPGLIGLALAFNLVGTLQCTAQNPPGITTQFNPETVIDHRYDGELAQFLLSHGETRGYSDYWLSYPLAFQTGEQLIFPPLLPYHRDLRYTARDDRYAPYDELVKQSTRAAYISTNHPALDDALRSGFNRLGITWKEQVIGDYLVFYQLSSPVTPQQIVEIAPVQ